MSALPVCYYLATWQGRGKHGDVPLQKSYHIVYPDGAADARESAPHVEQPSPQRPSDPKHSGRDLETARVS